PDRPEREARNDRLRKHGRDGQGQELEGYLCLRRRHADDVRQRARRREGPTHGIRGEERFGTYTGDIRACAVKPLLPPKLNQIMISSADLAAKAPFAPIEIT